MPASKQVLRKLRQLAKPAEGVSYLVNRNPRNLERLRIAQQNDGYHLERPGRCFWYRLELEESNKYLTAKLVHFKDGTVLDASTKEFAIRQQLYKGNDTSAYISLAQIFATRCLQAGLTEMRCDLKPLPGVKVDKFLKTVVDCGLRLEEPARYRPPRPWDTERPEKPWEVIEEED